MKASVLRFVSFCTLLMLAASIHAQVQQITWEDLKDVNYATVFDSEAGYVYMKPLYGESLKKLDGKQVALKGYVLPMDVEGQQYAISAYPYSACFFCGGGSKESVAELWLADMGDRYSLDQIVTFTGILELNDEQFGLNYLIKDAKPLD